MDQRGHSYESALLLTLGEITQLVAHSHDPAQTLHRIVELVQGRFQTAVCSVYVLDADAGELVLGATVGLKPEAVGRVRMPLTEGLVGLAGQTLAPVNVHDAFGHPRFKYFPETGEDPFRSFLGVPLLQGGSLQGVLVLQTREARTFQPAEVRTLVTIAAQLAPLVGDARLLERAAVAAHSPAEPVPEQKTARGVPLSPGTGLGSAYIVDGFDEWRGNAPMRSSDPQRERQRLAAAMAGAGEELTRLSRHISELVGEDHGAILQAQLLIMQDRNIERDLEKQLAEGASAEGALFATLDQYVAAFQRIQTPFFQERVYDIKDVFHRLLWRLRPRPATADGDKVVLVAREASVMELFAVDTDQLAGVVVEHGGAQSHAAILARSLGIPMVGQVQDFGALLHAGRRLLVDGTRGVVVADPPSDAVAARAESRIIDPAGEMAAGLPRVEVNVNLLYETAAAVRMGAAGVGLYRSEFLFLARRTLPTEDEQVTIYRKLLHTMQGRPVCIRTFDLRPDKLASYAQMPSVATRPFDWRLVLESPPLRQLFREQVRAILRAATAGPVRMLIPLVTRSEIVDFALDTLAKARESLAAEALDFVPSVQLGLMIEVAAAVPMVPLWAEQVHFFALGTNDLTASALGLDRDDPAAAGQLDPLHPGLLRLVHSVVSEAHRGRKPVSVCGEIAADPLGAVALAALEVDSLSVAVNQYPTIREAFAALKPASLADLRPQLLRQRTARGVRLLLEGWGKK
ncbi:MAG: GAF domain-containing protein [Gemmataceae bacterium]|nr:GAF domain-containing protein [Gemmataceae bacterium]